MHLTTLVSISVSLVLFSVSQDLAGLGLGFTVLWSHLTSLIIACNNNSLSMSSDSKQTPLVTISL